MSNGVNRPIVGITGATGLLGQRVVSRFIEQGYHVVGYVRRRAQLEHDPRCYSEVQGTLADACQLEAFIKQVDICIHLAAHVGHGRYREYHAVNVEGTQAICETIAKHNPRCRLVYCSSIATLKYSRAFPWLATKYARSKYRAGQVVQAYVKTRHLNVATIYPGMIYGPGDQRFVPTIVKKLKQGKLFFVSGGEKHAPLVHVDDLAELFYLAAIKEQAIGREYIGVKAERIGMHRFIQMIADEVRAPRPRVTLPKWLLQPVAIALEGVFTLVGLERLPPINRRVVDVLSLCFTENTADANALLGWAPRVEVQQGLRQTLAHMKLLNAKEYTHRLESQQVNT